MFRWALGPFGPLINRYRPLLKQQVNDHWPFSRIMKNRKIFKLLALYMRKSQIRKLYAFAIAWNCTSLPYYQSERTMWHFRKWRFWLPYLKIKKMRGQGEACPCPLSSWRFQALRALEGSKILCNDPPTSEFLDTPLLPWFSIHYLFNTEFHLTYYTISYISYMSLYC